MDRYTKQILELLKATYIQIAGDKQYQTDSKARFYYLETLEDNLYLPMSVGARASYNQGSGSEIDSGKMNALRSSSAMTYNLFWDQVAEIVNASENDPGNGVYQVEFEKQYHTLKPSVSNRPANLDAFLYCKHTKEAVACEMKMTEWLFNKPGELKQAYLEPANYPDPDGTGEAGRVFASVAKSMVLPNDYESPDASKATYPGFTARYDAFQMFKHAAACYTACVKEEPREIKKLTLVNCVWTLPAEMLSAPDLMERYRQEEAAELAEFERFRQAMEPVKALFAAKGVQFDIRFYTFAQFLALLHKTPEELEYLRRYTLT